VTGAGLCGDVSKKKTTIGKKKKSSEKKNRVLIEDRRAKEKRMLEGEAFKKKYQRRVPSGMRLKKRGRGRNLSRKKTNNDQDWEEVGLMEEVGGEEPASHRWKPAHKRIKRRTHSNLATKVLQKKGGQQVMLEGEASTRTR